MSIIDSRDLSTELDELEDRARDDDQSDPLNEDEAARLAELRDLAQAVGSEWRHGETLIPEDLFEDYARELADDLGYTDTKAAQRWPFTHIDWEAAADELREDYLEAEFDGVTYLFRTS